MSAIFEGLPVKSVSIEAMLLQRDGVIDRFERAIATLREARDLASAAGVGFPRLKFDENRYQIYNMLDDGNQDDVSANLRKAVDSDAWQYLLLESGLRTFMDAKARAEWDDKIVKGEFPPFTRENIHATFGMMYDARGDMFERGVIRCFKELSWCYKTNLPHMFGKRLITRVGYQGFFDSRGMDTLEDLQRVLCLMDGKPEEDHRNGLQTRLRAAARSETGYGYKLRGEFDDVYMHIRWFKNGNAHVTFKRLDLRDKLNGIIAKHYPGALPAPRECR